jgi:ectoine hydroxylase-related dioxygenase (phytanoyl-CoA dioxygenase family)
MPKLLSEVQVAQYERDGYLAPVRVMDEATANDARHQLETIEAGMGETLRGDLRHKPHLLLPFLNDIVRHPVIVDAIEDLLGPDLLVWSSSFFIKEADTPSFVSWHQDSTYWGLSAPDVATAWVAFTPSDEGNGAMAVIPRSHTMDQVPHRDTFDQHNLLTRGQEIAVEVDESEAVPLVLRPGEMSLHHVRLVHGSPPNPSGDRRIGYAIRYIPTSRHRPLQSFHARAAAKAAARPGDDRISPAGRVAQCEDPVSRHRDRQL